MLAYIKFGDEVKITNCQTKITVKCTMYTMLSAVGLFDNYNGIYVLYGPIVLGPAEHAMPWIHCYFTNGVKLIL